ncbi:glycosyltransferase [Ferruginibacter sp. SUN106]|uniref:glycosyltransferase n=1 Tax=Ferruginibacter sp. SUN106 TaxID=2978348 RepID=UPI003D35F663
MKGKDFIITGLQSWDIPIGSNAIDIAKEIAIDNRVLYVNSPLDMMTMYRNKPTAETSRRLEVLKKRKKPIRKISKNLWVLDFPFYVWSINGLPDGFLFDFFNKANNRKIFRYTKKVADKLGFINPIHFIDNDIYRSFYAKQILDPKLSVYYRRDNVQPYAYWKKHAVRLEPKLIHKSDLVVCNSPQLADYAKNFNNKSYDVGQGVDLSAYNTEMDFPVPAALQAIPQPRIGYIGDINSMRLDADLIYELAKSKPGYSFVMIGNEDKVFAAHALHNLKNVHFTGSIAKQQVPEYMNALDVCLNPQLINEITIGNYPRKVDEYLALGKPVIATTTHTMELFKDHVYLCADVNEYKTAVEKALIENSEEKKNQRIIFARSHSWHNNVQEIYNQIEKIIN